MSERQKITAAESRKTLGRAKSGVMMPVPDTLAGMPEGYPVLLSGIKEIITRERIKAVMSANVAMVLMYWDIGQSPGRTGQWCNAPLHHCPGAAI